MREYKFRVWDGKEMHDNVVPWRWDFVISKSWHRCEKSTGNGILGSGGKTGEFLVPGIAFKELMQFTGLKDKNENEIYEGDIVRLIEPNRLYTVEWIEYTFKLVHADPKLERMHWGSIQRVSELMWSIEVIGNIFETPDLVN